MEHVITLEYKPTTRRIQIKISSDSTDLFESLRDAFGERIPGAAFAKKRNPFAATKQYAITPTGQCEIGLYWEIKKWISEKRPDVKIVVVDELKLALIPNKYVKFNEDIKFDFELYDYQQVAVQQAIKLGRGTVKLATGGGKTFITAALIENYYRSLDSLSTFRCLVIVPDLGLVEQTYKELNNCGCTFTCSKWTGKIEFDPEANVVICNTGVLTNRFHENEWLKHIDLLIVDECHKIKRGNEMTKIISKIFTHRKYGLTGTLPERLVDVWNIMGKFGPIVYEKPSHELISEGFLTNVHVSVLDIHYTQSPSPIGSPWHAELDFIAENAFRNKVISKLCGIDNNILILINNISHGEILFDTLSALVGKQVFFVQGSMDVDEREYIKSLMERDSNVICIAISAIFSTGINIKNIHTIIFAAGGKSPVRTVQSIGRGLRKHKSKIKLNIIDISDHLRYGMEHSIKRCEIYDKEHIKYSFRTIKE